MKSLRKQSWVLRDGVSGQYVNLDVFHIHMNWNKQIMDHKEDLYVYYWSSNDFSGNWCKEKQFVWFIICAVLETVCFRKLVSCREICRKWCQWPGVKAGSLITVEINVRICEWRGNGLRWDYRASSMCGGKRTGIAWDDGEHSGWTMQALGIKVRLRTVSEMIMKMEGLREHLCN